MPSDTKFALGMFSRGTERFCGIVVNQQVGHVQRLYATCYPNEPRMGNTTQALLDDWELHERRLQQLANRLASQPDDISADARFQLIDLRVEAPLAPRQILQAGANYRQHVVDLMVVQKTLWPEGMSEAEFRKNAAILVDARTQQAEPYLFSGLPSAITGPFDDIVLPQRGSQHDWELELVVVIGRPAYRVHRDQALGYVAGYTIANDLTTRDLVFRPDLPSIGTDWLWAKNAPTFLPLGPTIVPARFVSNPMDLQLSLRLNGELMQNESTSDMLYDVARLIEHATAVVQLSPGDILLTGSPAGNGAHYNRFLRPGDVIESSISGLGTQKNRCVAS